MANEFSAYPSSAAPLLHEIKQVSDGWIKKYELTYTMPDGSLYT